VTGINRKNRNVLKYPTLESARRPVANFDEYLVPIYTELPDTSGVGSSRTLKCQEDEEEEEEARDDAPHPSTQNERNDIVRVHFLS